MNPARTNANVRVMVAVGSAAPDPATLEAAAQLARIIGAELATLFIEDTDLLRLAELPIAYEISAALPTPRPFATSDVERSFKTEAAELRRALAEIAGSLDLQFTFEVVRGKPASALLNASAARDLVVLAGAASRTLTHLPAVSVVRRALRAIDPAADARRVRPVAAVIHPGPAVSRMLAIAHDLARANTAGLVLFLAADDGDDAPLAASVERWLALHGASARIIAMRDNTTERAGELVATADPRVVFWPGDGYPEMSAAAQSVLAAIRCPLIVVR